MRRVFKFAGVEIIVDTDAVDVTTLGGVEGEPGGGQKACAGKDRLDQRSAEGRVRSLEKKYRKPYDAYQCDDHWHVGHSRRYFTLEGKYGE